MIDTYHQPVAPIVPEPDMTVARIVAQGDLAGAYARGMAGVAAINAQRQQAELAAQKITQDAIQSEQGFQLARERMAQDAAQSFQGFELTKMRMSQDAAQFAQSYDLNLQKMDNDFVLDEYKLQTARELAPVELDVKKAELLLRQEQAKLAARGMIGGMYGQAIKNQQVADTINQFQQRSIEFDLANPNPSNAVEYFAKVRRLEDEFAGAKHLPQIKNELDNYKRRTDQHTIPIYENFKDGKPVGAARQVPVAQIVENLQHPGLKEKTQWLLKQNNYITEETPKYKGPGDKIDKWTPDFIEQRFRGGERKPVEIFKESIRPYLDLGKGVDFSRGKPRVMPKGIYGTEPNQPIPQRGNGLDIAAEEPGIPDAPIADEPIFEETETDRMLKQARAALGRGAPRDAVLQMLQAKGIDAGYL